MKYDFQVDMDTKNAMALVLKKIKKQTRILEFGPATGYMTRYMKEVLECRVWGVEIDAAAAAQAAEYTESMVVCDADSLDWREAYQELKFDYILFVDVLEHLRNPLLVLQNAKELLADDGTMLISVPNIAHNAVILELLQGRFNYQNTGLLDDTHIHFFTRQSLQCMLQSSGLMAVTWQATLARPEDTELGSSYDQVPEVMEELLRQRTEGHTYQWIVEVKALAEPTDCEAVLSHALEDDEIQLFFGSPEEWNEANCLRYPLSLETDGREYVFSFPWPGSGSLRLDPGNRPAFCDLAKLELLGEEGQTVRPSVMAAGDALLLKETDSCLSFLCYGSDPQLWIETAGLEGKTQQTELRFSLQVKRSLESSLAPLLAEFVQVYRPELENTGVLWSELRRNIAKWESEAERWQQDSMGWKKEAERWQQEYIGKKENAERLYLELQALSEVIERKDHEMGEAQQSLRELHEQLAALHGEIHSLNIQIGKLQTWQQEVLSSKGWRWGHRLPGCGKRLFPI